MSASRRKYYHLRRLGGPGGEAVSKPIGRKPSPTQESLDLRILRLEVEILLAENERLQEALRDCVGVLAHLTGPDENFLLPGEEEVLDRARAALKEEP